MQPRFRYPALQSARRQLRSGRRGSVLITLSVYSPRRKPISMETTGLRLFGGTEGAKCVTPRASRLRRKLWWIPGGEETLNPCAQTERFNFSKFYVRVYTCILLRAQREFRSERPHLFNAGVQPFLPLICNST